MSDMRWREFTALVGGVGLLSICHYSFLSLRPGSLEDSALICAEPLC
jgi:hypothetical protein